MKKCLLLLVSVFLIGSCAEEFAPDETSKIEEIESNYYDPSLPGMVMFVTPGNSFAIGETIVGWDNEIYEGGGEARPDTGNSTVPENPRGGTELWVEPHLGLYQNGVFVRELGEDEVNIYFDRIPGIDNSTKNFEWKIPAWQALGDGYTLKFWETIYDGIPWCCHTGEESIEFSIVAANKVEIIEPKPWINNYTEGAPLNYGIRLYCNAPTISVTVSIFKGLVLKGTHTFNSVPVYESFAYINSVFLLSTSDYPVGTDYRFVIDMSCNGSIISHTEYFQISESVGGGIAPPQFLPGGW